MQPFLSWQGIRVPGLPEEDAHGLFSLHCFP